MKQFLILFSLLLQLSNLFAQAVAINTDGTVANISAILDVKSTNKGILLPRMNSNQRLGIGGPAAGLLVYDTDLKTDFYYDGTAWRAVNTAKAVADLDGDTKIQVEESPNDNTIRFDISGDERMKLSENSLGSPMLELVDINRNTLVGTASGSNITSGTDNTSLGQSSLSSLTSGTFNTALGVASLFINTNGHFNVAVGSYAMRNGTTGSNNTAVGSSALAANTGNNNTGVGAGALLSNTSGVYNTAVGDNSQNVLSTGNSNSSLGAYALGRSNATENTAVGYTAGGDWLNSSYNTFIGSQSDATGDGFTNATAIGYQAAVTGSNKVRIGNGAVTEIGGQVNWSAGSDARFKQAIKADVPGLAFINKLRPVTYNFNPTVLGITSREPLTRYTGFIAQEVEKAAKEIGFEFSGVVTPASEQEYYALRYAEFTVPLVQAVQELDAENKQLKAALAAMANRLETLEANISR